jgi:hypothetical protein
MASRGCVGALHFYYFGMISHVSTRRMQREIEKPFWQA